MRIEGLSSTSIRPGGVYFPVLSLALEQGRGLERQGAKSRTVLNLN